MAISFRQPRRVYLAGLFASCLVMTFLYFYFYPESMEKAFPFLAATLLGLPVVALFTCLIFPFCEKPGAFTFVKTEAALYAAVVFISVATFQDNGSVGSIFARMHLEIMTIILIILSIIISIKNYRHRKKSAHLLSRWLFRDVLVSILAGWFLGILSWSFTTPAVIIAAAEKMAGGAPYCINAHSGPARSLLDLTALRFYSLSYRWRDMGDRHGTLSVVAQADTHHPNKDGVAYRHSFYWSYRLKAFVPDYYYIETEGSERTCIPDKDFANKLPLFPSFM